MVFPACRSRYSCWTKLADAGNGVQFDCMSCVIGSAYQAPAKPRRGLTRIEPMTAVLGSVGRGDGVQAGHRAESAFAPILRIGIA